MPIYEYKCTKCGYVFEAFQRMGADGSELNCPVCNAAKPKKLFSSFASSGGGSDSRSNGSCTTGGST